MSTRIKFLKFLSLWTMPHLWMRMYKTAMAARTAGNVWPMWAPSFLRQCLVHGAGRMYEAEWWYETPKLLRVCWHEAKDMAQHVGHFLNHFSGDRSVTHAPWSYPRMSHSICVLAAAWYVTKLRETHLKRAQLECPENNIIWGCMVTWRLGGFRINWVAKTVSGQHAMLNQWAQHQFYVGHGVICAYDDVEVACFCWIVDHPVQSLVRWIESFVWLMQDGTVPWPPMAGRETCEKVLHPVFHRVSLHPPSSFVIGARVCITPNFCLGRISLAAGCRGHVFGDRLLATCSRHGRRAVLGHQTLAKTRLRWLVIKGALEPKQTEWYYGRYVWHKTWV